MTQTPVATFKGREIELQIPSDSQILVWNRIGKQFGELSAELEPLEPGVKLSDELAKRHRKMVNRLSDMLFALIANEDDATWLEDEILAGRVVDSDLTDLFSAFTDALEKPGGDADENSEGDGEQQPKPAPKKRSTAARTKK